MADKLLQYYKYIAEVGGYSSKMQLAIETKIPSTKAAFEPDSPENIATFKKAIEKLTGKPAPNF